MLFLFLRSVLLLTSIFNLTTASYGNLELPDYDYSVLETMTKDNIRRRFLEKRIRDKKDKIRKLMLKNPAGNLVYLDDIAHFEVQNNNEGKIVRRMEREFRKLLAMRGVTYVFKRDSSWRTWREVDYPRGKKIVCYRCSNVLNATCKSCRNGGYWIIEDNPPPCPYELFAMKTRDKLCASHHNQLTDITTPCPSMIDFYELSRSCDNPIITSYRITKNYNSSERVPNEICDGNDFCEVSTFYRIYKDYVLFRIANSTNDIIFSKIMKGDQKNYACLSNCGQVDPSTRLVTKNDTPISFDLLPSHKSKRESGKFHKKHKTTKKFRKGWKNVVFKTTTTKSPCQKMQTTTEFEDYPESDYYN